MFLKFNTKTPLSSQTAAKKEFTIKKNKIPTNYVEKPVIKDSVLYFAGQSRACCHCTNPQEKFPYSHERGKL